MSADKSKKVADEMEVEDEEEVQEEQMPVDESFDVAQPKYRSAAQVVNDVIVKVIGECQPGKKVIDICEFGDNLINAKVKSLYKKAPKGIAFPTCISVNNIVCHYSPMDGDALALKINDVVHIDCGVHCDGYIATAATTIVLSEQALTGKAADALAAAEKCMDAAMRVMKPGHTNTEVTNVIQKVCNEYGVNACEGVLSHQLKRFVIDSRNVILGKATPQQQVDEFKFGENEVYALDIVISTGQGKLRETEFKPSIYKRNPETTVMLKRKSSKQTLSELAKFEGFPFSARSLDKKTGRMGIIELFRTGLVDPYPILCEKSNEFVAHIKNTIFISTAQVSKATVVPVAKYASAKVIQDKELNELLASSLKIKDKSKKAAPAAAAASDAMQE